MKSAVFLQVRLDSTRFPQKALKPIAGLTVIEHAMRSLKKIPAEDHILLTAAGDEGPFQELCSNCGFKVFSGDRDDVLDRFIQAARLFTPEIIIRATGDNPLVSWEMATEVLETVKKSDSMDYAAMKGLPIGCGVEVFRTKALETAYSQTTAAYDHEHVTPYIYNNPDQFSLQYLRHSPSLDQRVTLDTEDDYRNIREIFDCLYDGEPIPFAKLKTYLTQHEY